MDALALASAVGQTLSDTIAPQASPNVQLLWLPVLESGISAVCPTCELVINIGRKVAAAEELPDWIRGFGVVAVVGALFLGTGFLIDALLAESRA